jgi:hypothetical protein
MRQLWYMTTFRRSILEIDDLGLRKSKRNNCNRACRSQPRILELRCMGADGTLLSPSLCKSSASMLSCLSGLEAVQLCWVVSLTWLQSSRAQAQPCGPCYRYCEACKVSVDVRAADCNKNWDVQSSTFNEEAIQCSGVTKLADRAV